MSFESLLGDNWPSAHRNACERERERERKGGGGVSEVSSKVERRFVASKKGK